MFKIFTILLSLFVFIGQITLPVFAQTKVARKSTARKATSSSAKKTSGKTVRAATSSKSNIRSATGRRTSSASRTSSRARVDSRTNGGTIRNMGTGVSSDGSASGAANTNNCKSWYTECMDIQIANIISSYPYLADDPAVQSIQETGDPLRCIYYDTAKVEEIFGSDITGKYCSSDLMAKRQTMSIDDKTGNSSKDAIFNNLNFCSNQKNLNELYMAYNYYCDLNTSEVSALGMPINKCNIVSKDATDKNSVFATKDSMAYYAEANRRVENGELKIINFEKTNLFKNKISKMNLENWDMMSLDYEDTNDLLADLGLTADENELFSINVVPPVGAGNLNPAGVFKKASDICFSKANIKLAGKKATESESRLQTLVNQLAGCDGVESRADLERYYLAGTWRQDCPDGYYLDSLGNTCISLTDKSDTKEKYTAEQVAKGKAELMDTDFLSAKKSCDMYEQTLISTRNAEYGKFDTQLKNYIEDEVAKLIKRKTKDLNTIASAFQSLQQMDADISINLANMKADIANAKSEAEIAILNADLNLSQKRLEVDQKTLEARRERAKMYSEQHTRKITQHCSNIMFSSILANCGSDFSKCFNLKTFFSDANFLNSLATTLNNQNFYMNIDGDIIPPTETICIKKETTGACVKKSDGSILSGATEESCTSGFYEWKADYVIEKEVSMSECTETSLKQKTHEIKQNITEKAPEGYEELYCIDMPNFKEQIMYPTISGIDMFYNALLTGSCTGDMEMVKKMSVDWSSQYGGQVGSGWGEIAGKNAAQAVSDTLDVITTFVGDVITDIFYNEKVSYSNAYMTTTNEGGYCVRDKKTSKKVLLWTVDTSTSKETVPALKDYYIGKGKKLFNEFLDRYINIDLEKKE